MEYTAIGHTVNTAARVEGSVKALNTTIAVTHITVAASGWARTCIGAPQEMSATGRQEAVRGCEVLGSHVGDTA